MSDEAVVVEKLEGDAIQVNLPGELTISASSGLHEALRSIVESTEVVTLDASKVQRVDTAGVQLLVAFANERRDQSLVTDLRQRPEKLVAAIDMLGLAEQLS